MTLGAGICAFWFVDQADLAQTGFRSKFVSAAHLLHINVDSIVSPARDETLNDDARIRHFTQVQRQLLEPQWKKLFALSYHIEMLWAGCAARIIPPGSAGYNEVVTALQGFVVRGPLKRKEIEHLVRLAEGYANDELSLHNYEKEVDLLRDELARRVAGQAQLPQGRMKLVLRGLVEGIPYLGPALVALLFGDD